MSIEEFFFMILAWVIGSILSAVILGFVADKFIIRKIMQNEDVQDLLQLFREGKKYLKEILENQKKDETVRKMLEEHGKK